MATERHLRPSDPAQLAKLIVDIATGEVEDREPTPEERRKDPSASAMGRNGGPVRAAKLYGASPEAAKGRYSPAECIGTRQDAYRRQP
jgi:hypothetical protein